MILGSLLSYVACLLMPQNKFYMLAPPLVRHPVVMSPCNELPSHFRKASSPSPPHVGPCLQFWTFLYPPIPPPQQEAAISPVRDGDAALDGADAEHVSGAPLQHGGQQRLQHSQRAQVVDLHQPRVHGQRRLGGHTPATYTDTPLTNEQMEPNAATDPNSGTMGYI